MYLSSAPLLSLEIDCFYALWHEYYEYGPPIIDADYAPGLLV